jgi:hypothetical protein
MKPGISCLLVTMLLICSAGVNAQVDDTIYESGDPTLAPETPGRPPGGPPADPLGFSWSVNGGDLYQFKSSIEGGGSFSVNRAFLGLGLGYRFTPSLAIGFKLSTEVDSYEFKDGGSFAEAAGGTPWSTVNELSIGTSVQWKIDRDWSVFGSASINWAAEPSADWGNAMSGSGVIAGSYTFSRDLSLGLGVLASGRLDGSVLFIPSILIDWKITEGLVVTNVRGPATYPASAGIEILYSMSRQLTFSVGFRYEYRRFRLDDSGPEIIQGGVGTERSFPVWLRLEWRPAPKIRLHLLGGVSFGERLELQRADGSDVIQQDANPAPFVALFFGLKF